MCIGPCDCLTKTDAIALCPWGGNKPNGNMDRGGRRMTSLSRRERKNRSKGEREPKEAVLCIWLFRSSGGFRFVVSEEKKIFDPLPGEERIGNYYGKVCCIKSGGKFLLSESERRRIRTMLMLAFSNDNASDSRYCRCAGGIKRCRGHRGIRLMS